MTKTMKATMMGAFAAAAVALLVATGCTSTSTESAGSNGSDAGTGAENAAADNAADDNAATDGTDDGSASDDAATNAANGENAVEDETVIRMDNGWIAYSGGDMLMLLDADADTNFQWTAEVEGSSVLKGTDADLPSSLYYDQDISDVVGSSGMHVVSLLADDQNNGESTITLKLSNTADDTDVRTTIVVKADAENGTFKNVTVQE
ncbi:protease inhibitor I42 family protein [Rubneribacter sp.]